MNHPRRMKKDSRLTALAVAASLLVGAALGVAVAQDHDRNPPKPAMLDRDLAVYFSPDGDAARAVVYMINQARTSVYLQAYMFTHRDVKDALIQAKQRGLDVQVVLDRGNADVPGSMRMDLRRAGITVFLAPEDMKMHNKVVIIDKRIVITGSMNFTYSADRSNVENIVIINDRPQIAGIYTAMHEKLCSISKKYSSED